MLALRIVLLTLIAATLVFIFVNSALPPEKSSEASDGFSDFIATIIPPDTTLGGFIKDYIRKIAHFTEYGLLGMLLALYLSLFAKRRVRAALFSPLFALVVGFIDESIQIASKRGPEILDVWIDIGGFVFFSLIAYGVIFLVWQAVRLLRTKKTEIKEG